MKKTTLLALTIASVFSPLAMSAELPEAGTYAVGAQVSFGNFKHDKLDTVDDKDGSIQLMTYFDYYFAEGWAIEIGISGGDNVRDGICKHGDIDTDDDYCTDSGNSNSTSFKTDLEYSNIIVALRLETKVSENSFVYGKLGAQYFDYDVTEEATTLIEDSGTGIYSELGWRYEWSNRFSVNVGYQHIAMSYLTTSSVATGINYRF